MLRYIKILFFIFVLLNGHILYAQRISVENGENPDDISSHYKELINNGTIKPLSMLKTENEEKYNLIISFIPNNELIENYYYIIDLHKNKNIEYSIYYYERLFNKYRSWRGDPTGKCFSVLFNKNGKFLKKYLWR
jgi:hypothetical protein